MDIQIIQTKISQAELVRLAESGFGNMIKGVADIRQKIIALGGELHADGERVLLDQGSRQSDVWGFNIYPAQSRDRRIEFFSLINIRPNQKNYSQEIKDPHIQETITKIVDSWVE